MHMSFKDLQQIPYVVGAVDGSHIPIVAPGCTRQIIIIVKASTQFYCRGSVREVFVLGF